MKSLRTARVLIIDDTAGEAMPVVEALGRLGVGCAYVAGEKVEEVEKLKPFSGIRLAFVDMKLGIEGTAKEVVGKTVKVLKMVLAKDSLPLVLVAWTQHPEYVDAFKEALAEELPFLRPLIVHRMQKPIGPDGNIRVPAIVASLRRILSQHWPLGVLWDLEQIAHDATTETTQSISEVVSKDAEANQGNDEEARADAWFRALKKILKVLIVAGAGRSVEERTSQQGMLETFSAMQFERFQSVARPFLVRDVSKLCEQAKPKLSIEQVAVLNSMLLLLPVHPSDHSIKPGNLYVPRRSLKSKCPVIRCGVKIADLASSMPFRLSRDAEWKKLDAELQKAKRGNTNVLKFEKAVGKRKQAILRNCIPILLELTPACDHAQNKSGGARFIAGILVPDAHGRILEWGDEAPFLRRLEPLTIPGKLGIWHLVLSARALYSISAARKRIHSIPQTRLREGIQNDLRAWFATHAARPGYLSVR
jgi:hypothetical protein